jgi:hypothetical protein
MAHVLEGKNWFGPKNGAERRAFNLENQESRSGPR